VPKFLMACLVIVASFLATIPTTFADDFASVEARLHELGLTIPEPYESVANYVAAKRVGNLVFLSGHSECEEPYITGKVGSDRTVAEGYEAARLTALCLLASLKAKIGDLDKVVQIVKVNGMVNATEGFKEHSKVMNGCSDLLIEIFGERGRHARAAVGMASLPLNLTVEIEMIVEVTDEPAQVPESK